MPNPLRRLSHTGQTICVVIGGILVHLTLGTLYTVGNINPYLASYFRSKVPGQQYVTYSLMTWLYTCTVLGQTISVILGGVLERKIGPRWSTLIGCAIMSFGVFITYFSIQHSFWLTLFTYGFIVGVGTGIGYNPPLVCVIKWMPNNRGLANGLILAGFGLGAFIFNQVETSYVNPWNHVVDVGGFFTNEDLLNRVPKMFFLLSGIYIIMQIIGCLLLMDPPETTTIALAKDEDSEPLLGRELGAETSASYAPIENSKDDEVNVTPRNVLKSVTFWCLWFSMLFNGQAVNFISGYFKIFGQTFIRNDYLLASVGSLSSIFNALGRVIWGHLGDRFSYQSSMMCVSGFLTVWMLTIYATKYMGEAAYFIWISGVFLSFSGQFSLLPMSIANAFGMRYFGVNYGLLFTSSAVTTVLNSLVTTILLEKLEYQGMFELLAAWSFLAFCVTAFIHLTDYGKRIGMDK